MKNTMALVLVSGYVNGVRYTNLNPVNHYIKAINEGKTNTI